MSVSIRPSDRTLRLQALVAPDLFAALKELVEARHLSDAVRHMEGDAKTDAYLGWALRKQIAYDSAKRIVEAAEDRSA